MDICPEVKEMIASLAKRLNVPESAIIERSVRGYHKRLTNLDKYQKAHPNYGWGRTSEYHIWRGMMRRCFNPKDAAFPDYGGRGITVAPELQTFQGFLHFIGERPAGKSLDRINNDGNYEPANLRWASPLQQQNNKRSNDLITYEGKTQTLTAWALQLGMHRSVLWCRLYRDRWSIADAFTRAVTHITAPNGRVTSRKLTDAQIIEIATSRESQSVLAAKFGVVQPQVSKIKSGKRWGKLTGLAR